MLQVKDIKALRKKLGLTQSELADRSKVSQSLIAKIESGRLDPAYSKAQQIFNTLEHLDKKTKVSICDIMTRRVISLKPSESIKTAIKIMKHHSISQVPVIENKVAVGIITESNILDKLSNIEPQQIHNLKVRDIMNEPPPQISITASQDVASSLLKHFQMLLVTKEGKIIGLITKSDLINKIF